MSLALKTGFLLVLVWCFGCSSIHIESASSPERRAETGSDVQASQMQSNWLARFRSLPAAEQGLFLKRLVDSVNVNVIRYGRVIADQWHEFQDQEKREIDGAEIGEVLRMPNPDSDPFVRAYDAMAREAAATILARSQSASELVRLIPLFVSNMGESASAVYGLAETVSEYEAILDELKRVNAELSRRIEPELKAYR